MILSAGGVRVTEEGRRVAAPPDRETERSKVRFDALGSLQVKGT